MAIEIPSYTNILIELHKAVKMHNFYPEGHPQLDASVEKCYLLFRKSLEIQGEIKWKIDQKGFYDNKTHVAPGNAEVASLGKKLFFRRIKEITFSPRLTVSELKVLLSIVKLEPEDLLAQGGAEAVFALKDVTGVLINALRPEDLLKIKRELEEKKDKERKELAEEKKKEEEAPGEAQSQEAEKAPAPREEEEKADETTFADLISLIRDERDFIRYQDLSVRLKEKGEAVLMEKRLDEIFPACLVFVEHLSTQPRLADDLRTLASERLRSFLNHDMIIYLVQRLASKDETHRGVINSILLFAGEDAARALLDSIIDSGDAVARRNLFNLIVRFGKQVRPLVEERLSNPEWYVIRQMVGLLGELKDPAAIDAIETVYANPEPRVKKEALKSLVKIGGPRATAILIKTLGEEDPSIVAQAIISLGVLKDPSVADILGEIALRRESLGETHEPKREAIRALGHIGSVKAVPYLERLLFRKVWFGKKANEEIRILAANSLGMIGTVEAYKAVQEACKDASVELYAACRRILEGREKKANER